MNPNLTLNVYSFVFGPWSRDRGSTAAETIGTVDGHLELLSRVKKSMITIVRSRKRHILIFHYRTCYWPRITCIGEIRYIGPWSRDSGGTGWETVGTADW